MTHQSLLSLLFVGFFVENMACTRLAALCVGIEEYQYDIEECQHGDVPHGLHHLPNASRDANNFSREMLRCGFQDNNLFLLVGHVSQQKLKEGILKFLKYAEDNISREGVQFLVVFIAAHGKQPQGSELPVILASDYEPDMDSEDYENDMDSVLDLDTMLLKPLDSMQGGKIKAWIVLDTCRENKRIQTWTGHEEKSLKRSLHSSETDFQILLACDRGRVASDTDSLTPALLRALRSHPSDLEAVCKEAQTSIEARSSGRQRPWRYCRGDFSGISLPDEERPSQDDFSGISLPDEERPSQDDFSGISLPDEERPSQDDFSDTSLPDEERPCRGDFSGISLPDEERPSQDDFSGISLPDEERPSQDDFSDTSLPDEERPCRGDFSGISLPDEERPSQDDFSGISLPDEERPSQDDFSGISLPDEERPSQDDFSGISLPDEERPCRGDFSGISLPDEKRPSQDDFSGISLPDEERPSQDDFSDTSLPDEERPCRGDFSGISLPDEARPSQDDFSGISLPDEERPSQDDFSGISLPDEERPSQDDFSGISLPDEERPSQDDFSDTSLPDEERPCRGDFSGISLPDEERPSQDDFSDTSLPDEERPCRGDFSGISLPDEERPCQGDFSGTSLPDEERPSQGDFSGISLPDEERPSQGDFSGTSLPDEERPSQDDFSGPDEESPCMHLPPFVQRRLLRGTGLLLAVIVVLLWLLLEICCRWTWNRRQKFGSVIIEVILDTCVLCMSLTLDWLTLSEKKRSPLAQNLRLTILWWVCKFSTTCSLLKRWPTLAEPARLVTSMGSNILHACFLSSSIVLVLRLVALHPEYRTCYFGFNLLSDEFLNRFLPMVFICEIVVMASITHEAKSEAKFYVLCLFLGLICSLIAWRISYTITLPAGDARQHENTHRKLTRASGLMLFVKTVWCIVRVPPVQLALHETGFAFVSERICALLAFALLHEFAKLYGRLNQLPQ